jgi:hypothetical protein
MLRFASVLSAVRSAGAFARMSQGRNLTLQIAGVSRHDILHARIVHAKRGQAGEDASR